VTSLRIDLGPPCIKCGTDVGCSTHFVELQRRATFSLIRRTAVIRYSLCGEDARYHKMFSRCGGLLVLLGVIVATLMTGGSHGWAAIVSLTLIGVLTAILYKLSAPLSIARATSMPAWLRGVSKEWRLESVDGTTQD